MKFLLVPVFACAVSAFAPSNSKVERNLLSDSSVIRTRGVDPHNAAVDVSTVHWAAYAAQKVYETDDCSNGQVKYGDWTCYESYEKPYHYFFEQDETYMRMHFYTGPNNKCGFVFRGTQQDSEWWTNTNFLFKEPAWWFDEHIHAGYKDAFDGHSGVGGEIKGDISYFLNNDEEKKKCEGGVHFVGHSLGGALASTADIWYEHYYGKKATTITFGAPMMVAKKDNGQKKTVQELRIIHENDPVSSAFTFVMGAKGFEHRGPAKIIKCLSGETGYDTCSHIDIVDGDEQANSAITTKTNDWFSRAGWTPDAGYHSMQNYQKYVFSALEPKRLLGAACTFHTQCHSGYCGGSLGCRDEDGAVATVQQTAEAAYEAAASTASSIWNFFG